VFSICFEDLLGLFSMRVPGRSADVTVGSETPVVIGKKSRPDEEYMTRPRARIAVAKTVHDDVRVRQSREVARIAGDD